MIIKFKKFETKETELSKKYPTTLIVHYSGENNPLIDIITKSSNNNGSIENINTVNKSYLMPYPYEIAIASQF